MPRWSARARAQASPVRDLDVIESNEAFAVQALDFDPTKVNPNGSGISLGRPVGATGAITTTKAIYVLECIGADMHSP